MLTATFDKHLHNMPFVPLANSEVETERNGLTRAGQQYWKGPAGLFLAQKDLGSISTCFWLLTATTNVVSHYAF